MSLLAPLLRIYFFPYFQKRDLYSRLSYDKIAYKKKKNLQSKLLQVLLFLNKNKRLKGEEKPDEELMGKNKPSSVSTKSCLAESLCYYRQSKK